MNHSGNDDPSAPVLARRAKVARFATLGQRVGYLFFALFLVVMTVGFVVGFTGWLVAAGIGSLVLGSLVLAPAIVLAYGVKAADKEERGEPFGY